MVYKKGQTGNPLGRPKNPIVQELRNAIRKIEISKDKTFLEHFVERAFENDLCAIALAKKILPDLISSDEDIKNTIRTILVRPLPTENVNELNLIDAEIIPEENKENNNVTRT